MRFIVLLYLFLFNNFIGSSQTNKNYREYIEAAKYQVKSGNYLQAARCYENAFKTNHGLGTVDDRFSAAVCWSLSKNEDSSFFHLDKLVKSGFFSDDEKLTKEPAFTELHKDRRWISLVTALKVQIPIY